jgi:histidine triad (HIT) family protein
MASSTPEECFVCEKHLLDELAEGGVLYKDDLVYAGHVYDPMGADASYRGHLVIEPRRHVEGLGLLTDEEASRVGWLSNRLANTLRTALGAEHVYVFAFGGHPPSARTPAHLHVHLMPRYPGTPREHWGASLSRWPLAPRVERDDLRELVRQLQSALNIPLPPT